MEKIIEVTRTYKIKIDENHPEFEDFIKDYDKDTDWVGDLSAVDKMLNDAVKCNFSHSLPIVANGIIKQISTNNDIKIEILG